MPQKEYTDTDLFHEVQDQVRCHYEMVAIRDFLVRLCGNDRVDALLDAALGKGPAGKPGLLPARGTDPFIPVEFSAAAFRIGHSMVRGRYMLNGRVIPKPVLLDPATHPGPSDDLQGRRPLPENWTIGWSFFLENGKVTPQYSRVIDTHISRSLALIPGPHGAVNSLAYMTLQRGFNLDLPSGETVAVKLGLKPLTLAELELDPGEFSESPLWYYILKEAELESKKPLGTPLGPVGAALVAETFIWLATSNPKSVFHRPDWSSELLGGKEVTLAEIFRFAGLLEQEPAPVEVPAAAIDSGSADLLDAIDSVTETLSREKVPG